MNLQIAFYRIRTWFRHLLTARNTGGHGVHSPYLFELTRMVMKDKHSFYAWEEIEQVREQMLKDDRVIEFVDYGIGGKKNGECGLDFRELRRVRDIAQTSLTQKKYAQLLARIVLWEMRNEKGGLRNVGTYGGLNIVELGTSLGITTAYLASVDSRNKVVTYEGCEAVADIAKQNWRLLGLNNIECRVMEIGNEAMMGEGDERKLDLVFIDANHTYTHTREYFNIGVSMAHDKTIIVIDDIHHSPEMERAWKDICEDERVTSTIDLYQMGLVFFDPHYWHRNYKIRL